MKGARALAVLVCVLGVVASGCADAKATPKESRAPDPTAAVTQDDGGIQGTVVTAEFLPIVGAAVVVIGANLSANTSATGKFAFGPLPPADYLVEITASGFKPRKVGLTVLPGEITEARIILEDIPPPVPYIDDTYVYAGYLNVAANVTVAGQSFSQTGSSGTAVPEQYRTRSGTTYRTATGQVAYGVLLELEWTPGTSMSDDLLLRMSLLQTAATGCTYSFQHVAGMGKSPIRYRFDNETRGALKLKHPELCGASTSPSFTFAVLPAAGAAEPVGFFIEQQFKVHITVGYNAPLPPNHWKLPPK